MEYKEYSLYVKSDFDVKIAREWDCDQDLLIVLDERCLNINILEDKVLSRIQLPSINSIMIRHCKDTQKNIATFHFLSNDGLDSTIMNFEIDYSDRMIEVLNKEFFVELNIK